jgi:hypothetical protein
VGGVREVRRSVAWFRLRVQGDDLRRSRIASSRPTRAGEARAFFRDRLDQADTYADYIRMLDTFERASRRSSAAASTEPVASR